MCGAGSAPRTMFRHLVLAPGYRYIPGMARMHVPGKLFKDDGLYRFAAREDVGKEDAGGACQRPKGLGRAALRRVKAALLAAAAAPLLAGPLAGPLVGPRCSAALTFTGGAALLLLLPVFGAEGLPPDWDGLKKYLALAVPIAAAVSALAVAAGRPCIAVLVSVLYAVPAAHFLVR